MSKNTLFQTTIFMLACSFCTAAFSAPVTYTNDNAFFTAIAGYSSNTLFFDEKGTDAGDIIADGGELKGISFNYPVLADFASLQVSNNGDTTSGMNFLGTDDGGIFQDGDDLSLGFSATNAIGMYFLSADALVDGDIRISVAGTNVDLVAADLIMTLTDNTSVFFLGLLDENNAFTSMDIVTSYDDDPESPYFFWNIDDITTASVPAPSLIVLYVIGLLGVQRLTARKSYLA
ncbi:MAG: hypothetical protein GQ582_03585 [Methyloprofundus sp.]|nr:hypothetical protein [Methyloprofundus sp.]